MKKKQIMRSFKLISGASWNPLWVPGPLAVNENPKMYH